MGILYEKEALKRLHLEDYIALKQYAYDFFNKNPGIDLKDLQAYISNVLGYVGDEAEALLFSATVLCPWDQKFCKIYQSCENDLSKVPLFFPGIPYKTLKTKTYEIELFGLDNLVEKEILVPPEDPFLPKNEIKR